MSVQGAVFFVLSALFLFITTLWINEEFNPEWIKYQKKYYEEQALKTEKEYEVSTTVKEKELLGKKLAFLKNPVYEVKQIFLKGISTWAERENGDKVDRCMTCHIDEEELRTSHPEEFPFDIYGCSVCHEGNGRSLDEELAHEGMYYARRDMQLRLTSAETLFEFWDELAELTREERDPNQRIGMGNFRIFNITGDKAIYVGSKKCIKCHEGLTYPHVERWLRIKFKSLDLVKKAPDYIAGDEEYRKQCFKCHTTGYDEVTGEYSEEGVTCEACHGPGEVYSYFMEIGKASEGQKIAKVGTYGTPYNACGPCHHSRGHEMRLEFFQIRAVSDEWFFPQHTTPYKTSLSEKVISASNLLPKIH
ncbi:hypothetical protein LCGC14_1134860 [marine sediment metagenome]|uniref:Cytochrome c-552/4 domain-containing protein n=1 Tax=marine sediment metagenome TaxID=412755 RepID=A0A0F9PI81_9ZZZZ